MQTRLFFYLSALAICAPAGASQCIEKRKFIPIRGDGGMYQRVHPSGNYVLSSVDGRVSIYDLTKNPVVEIETPMNDETYPVEGSWDLLASPNHVGEGMKYFSFAEALRDGRNAKAKFNDDEHNEFYHSAAEFPGSTKEKRQFRTSLYTDFKYRDYTVTPASSGSRTVVKSEIKTLCAQITESRARDTSNDEALRTRMRDLEKGKNDSREAVMRLSRERNSARSRPTRQNIEQSFRMATTRFREQERKLTDVQRQLGLVESTNTDLDQPILSKDGQFIAAITRTPGEKQKTLQIFRINGEKCTRLTNVGFHTSKPSFAYPEKDVATKLTFTGEGLDSSVTGKPSAETISDQDLARVMASDETLRNYVESRRKSGDRDEKWIRETVAASVRSQAVAYVHDTGTGKTIRISEIGDAPAYPGYTRDGRVIYKGMSDGRHGFFVVDPNQVEGGSGKCITQEEAARADQNVDGASTAR